MHVVPKIMESINCSLVSENSHCRASLSILVVKCVNNFSLSLGNLCELKSRSSKVADWLDQTLQTAAIHAEHHWLDVVAN